MLYKNSESVNCYFDIDPCHDIMYNVHVYVGALVHQYHND